MIIESWGAPRLVITSLRVQTTTSSCAIRPSSQTTQTHLVYLLRLLSMFAITNVFGRCPVTTRRALTTVNGYGKYA